MRLGYEFNLACRAFNSIGVETSDLGPVPDLLRAILEDTLSQPASPQSLDAYLPKIRDIIINLLHGLKRKQSKLRTRSNLDGSSGRSAASSRQMSGTTLMSNDTGLTQMLDDVPGQVQSTMRDQKNDGGQELEDQGSFASEKRIRSRHHRSAFRLEPTEPSERHQPIRNAIGFFIIHVEHCNAEHTRAPPLLGSGAEPETVRKCISPPSTSAAKAAGRARRTSKRWRTRTKGIKKVFVISNTEASWSFA